MLKILDNSSGHDLIFPIPYSEYKEVKSEFINKKTADKFKDKRLDVFGIPYFIHV